MKLAVNYSEALLSLLEHDPALPVDYIKVPTIPFPGCFVQFERGRRLRRLLPHPAQQGVIALGHPDADQRFDRATVAEIIRRAQPRYLSTHLEARVEFFPAFRACQHTEEAALAMAMKRRFIDAIEEVRTATGLPLILENFPYYKWWCHFRLGSHPDFITEICAAADCGFLLDLAHAHCAAWHMGIDIWDYLRVLPLARVREIHVSGVQERAGEGLRDTHVALSEYDYQLLEGVLALVEPES
ncbi:MAG: DUF692 family multinuclear iron-containing protein [Bacteroidota bacterium]